MVTKCYATATSIQLYSLPDPATYEKMTVRAMPTANEAPQLAWQAIAGGTSIRQVKTRGHQVSLHKGANSLGQDPCSTSSHIEQGAASGPPDQESWNQDVPQLQSAHHGHVLL